MDIYTVFWRDGTTTELTGTSSADALNRAGIGSGAVRAIDFIGVGAGATDGWVYNEDERNWEQAE